MLATSAHSQQNGRYEIFNVIGSVSNASTGKKVKKGDPVKAADKLIIGKKSKAAILDQQQHRIYYSLDKGSYTVATIIRNAKRNADNAIAVVNSEMLTQLNQKSKRPNVMGVSYRGSDAENKYLQSVCNAIFDIANALPDDRLTLNVNKEDGAFYFSMANGTDSLLYVNVISVTPDENPQLCLNVGATSNQPFISIAPNNQLSLPDFVFAENDSADYYMFATLEPIDTQALAIMLSSGKRFEEEANATIIVSPKITDHINE